MITGAWNLKDLEKVREPYHGKKVFSCFHCGGGSTMGYKLAGYEVLGGVEIDPEMMKIYRANHNPKHSYLMGVQQFKNIPDSELPIELFDLDILDGSPPCSSFSIAGSREKSWSNKKKFREGQAEQILDTLFFDFIDIAKKLNPKIVIAENVKGLIQGNAKGYVQMIFKKFKEAGYDCQLFLLNASRMGVPQMRERTFFIANRISKKVKFEFNEPIINVEDAFVGGIDSIGKKITSKKTLSYYLKTKPGDGFGPAGGFNSQKKLNPKAVALTQISSTRHVHWNAPNFISDAAVIRLQSFPDDYKFLTADVNYVCGMSVPPFMMQRVAYQVYLQLLHSTI